MNKMQKLTCAKVLKVIFYLLGFPLLLLFVAKDSMVFFNEDAFSATAKDGITVVLLIWLAITLVHIGLYLVMKKQQALRTIILVVLAVVIMLAPVATFDKKASAKVDEITADYAGKGVVVQKYNSQTQWFNTLSDKKSNTTKLLDSVDNFISTYGLQGYYGHMYRPRTVMNTLPIFKLPDGTAIEGVSPAGGTSAGDLFADDLTYKHAMPYNPNGMLFDSYIFGVEEALDLLIEYMEFQNTALEPRIVGKLMGAGTTGDGITVISEAEAVNGGYQVYYTLADESKALRTYTGSANFTTTNETGKVQFDGIFYETLTVDEALAKAIATAEASPEWIAYSTSEDYVNKKALADRYVLSEERLNDILGTIFEYIGKSTGINDLIDGLQIGSILSLVKSLLDTSSPTAVGSVVNDLLYGHHDDPTTTDRNEETVGLAYVAAYLFGNIDLSTSMVRSKVANIGDAGYTSTEVLAANGDAPTANDLYILAYSLTYDSATQKDVVTMNYYKYAEGGTQTFTTDIDDLYIPYNAASHAGRTRYSYNAEKAIYVEDEAGTFVIANLANTLYYNGSLYNNSQSALEKYDDYAAILDNPTLTANPSITALTDLVKSLQPILPLVGGLLTGDTILGLVGGLLPGLDLGAILNAILKPGTLDTVVSALLGGIDLTGITAEGLTGLLMGILENLSFYQHPELKMSWDFMSAEDVDLGLQRYAWVKYHCQKFGITGGCVLVDSGALLVGGTVGNGTSSDLAWDLTKLYQLKADLEYQTELYPLFAARRYMAIWPGILAVSIFLSIYCYNKERKLFYEITTAGGNA